MPQCRVDPLTGLRTVIAGQRAARPGARPPSAAPKELGPDDPFAEGNEALTPPEVWADRPGGSAPNTPGWRARAVPNKFPALSQRVVGELIATGEAVAGDQAVPADGFHEVIINSPRAVRSLAELSPAELSVAVDAWAARMAAHAAASAYVHVCVNERREAGATLAHTHAQVFALGFIPPAVQHELELAGGQDPAAGALADELGDGRRIVAQDDGAVLLAPFASPTPYRLRILPRGGESRFEHDADACVVMLHTALTALQRLFEPQAVYAPPLNLWIRTAPCNAPATTPRWRIELAPRLGQPAGFELGTGMGLNSVAPEQATAELKAALR